METSPEHLACCPSERDLSDPFRLPWVTTYEEYVDLRILYDLIGTEDCML
jgi:hypothetical protein